MPVHIDEMETEVTVMEGDLPLSEAQIEKLVRIVIKRLQERQREARRMRESTSLRSQVTDFEPGSRDTWD
jgi:hypothetical protein